MKLNSEIKRNCCGALAVLLLAGCVTSGELNLLRYTVHELEKELNVVNEGLIRNQAIFHGHLTDLQSEVENGFATSSKMINDNNEKTHRLGVFTDADGFLDEPAKGMGWSEQSAVSELHQPTRLVDTNFWSSSGGREKGVEGNKEYLLTVAAPGSALIKLMSDEANSYLHLLDGSGVEVSKDDDSAEGNNALIEVYLDPGNYIVIASTYEKGASAGFALTISGIDGELIRL